MQPAGLDRFWRATLLALVAGLLCVPVTAQQSSAPARAPESSARDIPTPDQLEPGVNTTAAAPAASPAADAPAASTPAAQQSATPARPAAPAQTGAPPSAAAAPRPAASPGQAPAKTAERKGGPDRIELDTTDITGNRELPKVLYIVPWKHSDLGDLTGKPVNSLLDEVLQPLDRDVFQRENRYYEALKPGQEGAKAGAAQGSDNKP